MPLISAGDDRRAARGPRRLRRGGDDADDRARRPRPPTAASFATPSGEVERVVEAKAAGDADPEELAIREINAGTYAFDAAPLAAALGRPLQRQRPGRVLPARRLPGALREAGHTRRRPPRRGPRRDDGRQQPRRPRRGRGRGPPPHPRAHMLAGVTIVDPASTWIDADVEIAADARIEPGTSLRGATAVGAGSVVGPLTTLIDTGLGAGVAVPHSYLVECEVARRLQRRPLRLPAPRRRARARRQGRHLRRDQELAHRRRRQGPAPLLRRRRRRRRRQQPRRRHDHRQLRRFPQEPDGDRRPTCGSVLTRCWSRR